MPSRREREVALLKSLEDGTYQEFLDGDLVDELVRIIEASHKREDAIRALPFFVKDMDGEMEVADEDQHGEWMRADDVYAILDKEDA